ncbi:hypothetical protein [Delftia phage PhiW-14]|uniref:Uncharacterized protein n=1 Tax=Delftia phage PhiW-14 TaxID=665032 RepID=C9DG97_BPW14|nr:hypothetical protein DP-phiW-14_gp127 [Delftia phage PhiW-14]ACV50148.1 hypothetical protein [Delftia phage PhiW-14]
MIITFHLITSAVATLVFCSLVGILVGGVYIALHKAQNLKQAMPGIALIVLSVFLAIASMDLYIEFKDWLRLQLDLPCYQLLRCL